MSGMLLRLVLHAPGARLTETALDRLLGKEVPVLVEGAPVTVGEVVECKLGPGGDTATLTVGVPEDDEHIEQVRRAAGLGEFSFGPVPDPSTLPPGGAFTAVPCAHCGRPCRNYAGGYGTAPIGEDGHYARMSEARPGNRVVRLCHPNETGRPDCYRQITVEGRKLGDVRE